MGYIFDEQILKAPLSAMTPDGGNCVRSNGHSCRREQCVIGFIDLVAMPHRRKRQLVGRQLVGRQLVGRQLVGRQLVGENNRDLETAIISVADAIAYVRTYQRSQSESLDFQAYLAKLG